MKLPVQTTDALMAGLHNALYSYDIDCIKG